MKRKSKTIAVCGVDGSGKSTLIEMLKDEYTGYNNLTFLKKTNNANYNLLKAYHGAKPQNQRGWITSSFSRANAFACAFDFISHYYDIIYPQMGRTQVLICDRHKPCWLAYGYMVGGVYSDILDLLKGIPDPDHVFYIYASVNTIKTRLKKRGDSSNTTEAFAKAYEDVFKNDNNVTYISNDRSINETFSEFRYYISSLL